MDQIVSKGPTEETFESVGGLRIFKVDKVRRAPERHRATNPEPAGRTRDGAAEVAMLWPRRNRDEFLYVGMHACGVDSSTVAGTGSL